MPIHQSHQVEPVLGTTLPENHWLQSANLPQDITEILGTSTFKGYVKTPTQTLDGLNVNQPKQFLSLAKEAKRLAEEIRKEKEAKQWAGILHKQLLNQSFIKQLNPFKHWRYWHLSTSLNNISLMTL